MGALLQAIGSWPGAVLLQDSGTAYLFVNAAHILGISLLLGAILPLDLRLLGVFRTVPLPVLAPFLLRIAKIGFAIAALCGLWLFSIKPGEYVANTAFLVKVGLLILAVANVALQHSGGHFRAAVRDGRASGRVRLLAFVSACLWLSILVAGRWIGFL